MPASDSSSMNVSTFESIKHADEKGEYWSARELARVLEYVSWQKFGSAIERARTACENSDQRVDDHFIQTVRVTPRGKHGKYTVSDFQLSR